MTNPEEHDYKIEILLRTPGENELIDVVDAADENAASTIVDLLHYHMVKGHTLLFRKAREQE